MADASSEDFYALLGVSPVGTGVEPIQRVLSLSAIPVETIKEGYGTALKSATQDPFRLSKLAQAFQVLSIPDKRRAYDLQLMQVAASVTWLEPVF